MNDSLRHPRASRRLPTSSTNDDVAVGRRVAHHRRRKGLSQRDLAALLDRSTAWVSGVERGKYHLDRLPLLSNLSTALDVEVTDLVSPDAFWVPESNETGEDATGLVTALSSYPWLGAALGHLPDPVDLDDLAARLEALRPLEESADHAAMARALVEILPIAEAAGVTFWPAAATSQTADVQRAFRMVSWTYGRVAVTLFRLGHFAAACIAADRSVTTAGRADDRLGVAAAVLRVARFYVDDGRQTQALAAAESVARALAPVVAAPGADANQIGVAGAAELLLAEIAAVRWNRGQAEDHLIAAAALAARIEAGWRGYDLDFGIEAVDVQRVVVAVELQDAGDAVERARILDSRALSPQRRAFLLLQWARAEILRKAPDRALRLLMRADQLDPSQTAHFPKAWAAVEELGAMAERIHDRGDLATLQARVRRI